MKKLLIGLGIILVLIAAVILGLNAYFKDKIITFLDNAPSENVELSYGDIKVNTWQGTIKMSDVLVKLKKSSDTTFNTLVKSDQISLKDLSYWDYFFHKQIHIAKIAIAHNSIELKQTPKNKNNTKSKGPVGLNKEIIIDALEIGHTSLKIKSAISDSLLLDIKKASLAIGDVRTGPKIIAQKIPFTYDRISMQADSLFVSLNPYDALSVEKIDVENHKLSLKSTSIETRYSRQELSKIIDKERDHMNLKIPSLAIDGIDWGFKNDSLFTTAKAMTIHSPKLVMFRDKRVADDNSIKPLYSKMLRNLSFGLMLDSLKVDNASIVYSERINSAVEPGQINFSKLNIKGSAIGNTYGAGSKTSLSIKGFFLDDAPLDVDWSFNVNSPIDHFRFMASVGALDAARINNFTQPNLGAKMSGRINQVYFDVDGNNHTSKINMKMNYYNFKIEVLNKKSKKNWFVSAIANIFVSKNSKKGQEANFRNGEGSATRDETKSFFNYLWLSVRAGLIKTMIGKG